MDIVEQQKLEEEIMARDEGVLGTPGEPLLDEVGGARGDALPEGESFARRPAREPLPPLGVAPDPIPRLSLPQVVTRAVQVLEKLVGLLPEDKFRVLDMVKDELHREIAYAQPHRVVVGLSKALEGLL